VLEQSLCELVVERSLLDHVLEQTLLEHVVEQTPLDYVLAQTLLEFDNMPEQHPTTPNPLAIELNVVIGIHVCMFMCTYT